MTTVRCWARPAGVPTARQSALPAGSRAPASGLGWRDRRKLAPVQDALPDRAAEIFAAHHEIDERQRKQNQRRHAFELEAVVGHIAGQLTDRVAEHEKNREEVEYRGDYLAPGRRGFDGVGHGSTHDVIL